MKHLTTNCSEQGGIILYALLVVSFLSGLAAYLSAVSTPVLYQLTDTKRILSTEYLKDSTAEVFRIVTCPTFRNDPENAVDTLKYYKYFIFKTNDSTKKITASVSYINTSSNEAFGSVTAKLPVTQKVFTNKTFDYYELFGNGHTSDTCNLPDSFSENN